MAEDITPKLIDSVNSEFDKNCAKDKTIKALNEKLEAGRAKYDDAYKYAERIGEARAGALNSELSASALPDGKLHYNIASRLLNDSLSTDHGMVAEYSAEVQKLYNDKAGIRLKAQVADVDQDRIDGFIEGVCNADNFDDVKWKLGEPVVTHARTVVDDTIKKNAEFQNKAGLRATVSRKAAAKCCDWCADLDGDYVYPNVDREVFQRHDNCRCTLDYEGKRLVAYKSVSGKYNTFRDSDAVGNLSSTAISSSRDNSPSRRKWHGYNTKSEYVNRFMKPDSQNSKATRIEYAASKGRELEDARRANAIRVENIRNGISFRFDRDGGIITSRARESIEMDLQFFADKSKQYGKKIGKHAKDFGLDPSKQSDREKMVSIIDDIHRNSDEVRIGHWRGQEKDVLFHIKGNDVVITKQNEEFITILKDGTGNSGVKNARRK